MSVTQANTALFAVTVSTDSSAFSWKAPEYGSLMTGHHPPRLSTDERLPGTRFATGADSAEKIVTLATDHTSTDDFRPQDAQHTEGDEAVPDAELKRHSTRNRERTDSREHGVPEVSRYEHRSKQRKRRLHALSARMSLRRYRRVG
jgi:hypothetical protein